MCLAIYKPAGVVIDESALETGFENNDDGAGYTYRTENGQLKTYKGFFTFKQFLSYWRNHKHLEAMIHFRWMTSGKRNKDNCHPFRFGPKKSWSMIHNGVLSTRTTASESDTACFAKDVLHELAIRNMIEHDDVVEALEEEIGRGNKMVIMPPEATKPIILNEKVGFWENDAWWSNEGFRRTLFRYGTSSSYTGSSTAYNSHRNNVGNWWDVTDDEYHQWSEINKTTTTTSESDDGEAYLAFLEQKWKDGIDIADEDSERVTSADLYNLCE